MKCDKILYPNLTKVNGHISFQLIFATLIYFPPIQIFLFLFFIFYFFLTVRMDSFKLMASRILPIVRSFFLSFSKCTSMNQSCNALGSFYQQTLSTFLLHQTFISAWINAGKTTSNEKKQ